jgi:hypothetical protein
VSDVQQHGPQPPRRSRARAPEAAERRAPRPGCACRGGTRRRRSPARPRHLPAPDRANPRATTAFRQPAAPRLARRDPSDDGGQRRGRPPPLTANRRRILVNGE